MRFIFTNARSDTFSVVYKSLDGLCLFYTFPRLVPRSPPRVSSYLQPEPGLFPLLFASATFVSVYILYAFNDSLAFLIARSDHIQKQQLRGGTGDATLFPRMAELLAETRWARLHRAH